MKVFQSIIVAFIAIIAFSTGCQKSEKDNSGPTVTDNGPANFQNPYDEFGYLHNVILDSIEECRKGGKVVSFDSSCGLIRNFYRTKGWPELPGDQFRSVPEVTAMATVDINQLVSRSAWNTSVKEAISDLVGRMEVLEADSCKYPRLKVAITRFEDSIQHTGLPAKDQEVILKVASIARHSGFRWMQRTGWRAAYVNNGVVAKKSLLKKVGKWFVVTLCDMGGAVAELSLANAAACSYYMNAIMN